MNSNKAFIGVTVLVVVAAFLGFAFWPKSTSEVAAPAGIDTELLIKPHSLIKGHPDAKVTIVEFLDPECEACRAMHPILKQLMSEYEGKVRLVIRYMPLHGNSLLAASALEEARELGKFDQALDKLFETQPQWGDHHNPRPDLIAVFLKEIGMEEKNLDSSYLITKHKEKIEMDRVDGVKVGAMRTPTFFVNGKILPQIGYEPLKEAIDKTISEQP